MTDPAAQADDELEACFREVQTHCTSRGLSPVRLTDAAKGCLRLQLQGASAEWTIDVNCAFVSVTNLPVVRLHSPRQLLAHVSYGGSVCVNDAQGLSLDLERRAEVVAYTVCAAFDLLEKSAVDAAGGLAEFYNELEGYWASLPNASNARAAIEVEGIDRLVTAFVQSKNRHPFWYFTERGVLVPQEFYIKDLAPLRALYLRLEAPVTPPSHSETLEASFITALLSRLSPEQLDLWQQLVGPSKNGPRHLALLISLPRAAGGLSLIGVSFWTRGGQADAKRDVTPLAVRRHTTAYMRERGGASLELLGTHVVVFGCGAVGSEIADALATSGVGRLTLVDPDILSEDNVFRHVLPPGWIDLPKVSALKAEFTRMYPGIHIDAAPESAQNWLSKQSLDGVDGVVLALGLPTLERLLARRLRQAGKTIPLVFTWLEPLDLGGHSILISSSGSGCLDCLYRDDEGAGVLYPRTAFLEPDQHVSRNLTGCASVFVPYGALQSRHTALLAAEQMLAALAGAHSPSYRFWVGDGASAAKQGLRTTAWWRRAPATSASDATKSVFGRPCLHCRGAA